jgi:hypothetical protein
MSKIVINIDDTEKSEVLLNFLETIDYVKIGEVELSNYDNFLVTLKASCEVRGGRLIKPQEVLNNLSKSILASRDGNSKNNFVSFARNFLKFVFEEEDKIPSNPQNIINVLPKDAKQLLQYISVNNFIALSSFEHALKIKIRKNPDAWAVSLSDVLDFIEQKISTKGINLDEIMSNRPAVSREDLLEWFEEKTKN